MNDPLKDDLRRMHELFHRDHDRLREDLMDALPARVPAPESAGRRRRGWQWIGETKIKRRILGTTAVAAMLALATIGLWPGGERQVHGMDDAVDLLRQADVIHAQGWFFVPPLALVGQQRTRCPVEYWIDKPNDRQRSRSASYSVSSAGTTVNLTETVSNGEFTMRIDHTDQTVEYTRLSPFQMRVRAHRMFNSMIEQWFGDPERLGGFTQVAQERIDGQTLDVWQWDMELFPGSKIKTRIKSWIAPQTRQVVMLKSWMNFSGAFGDGSLVLDIETIERDVAVPAGTFDLDPPEGYTLINTRETVVPRDLSMGAGLGLGELSLNTYISFALEDGSILLAWSARVAGSTAGDGQAEGAQDALFSGLEFGGALPKLPVEIYGLTPMQAGTEVTLIGYHLAHTVKNGRFYEWSLYVPDGLLSEDRRPPGYLTMIRFNPADRQVGASGHLTVTGNIRISGRDDFDTLVLGAMAELSDRGVAPRRVAYDRVMQLSARYAEERPAASDRSND